MIATLVLAAALTGQQARVCQTRGNYALPARAVVSYPQAYTYAAPTYQQAYTPTYQQNYVEKTLFVPVQAYDREVYAAIVGDRLRQASKAQALAASDLALADQVGRLTEAVERLQGSLGGPPAPTAPPGQPPAPVVVTPPTGPSPGPPGGEPPPRLDAIGEAAWSILQARCAKCHTGPNPKGDFALFAEGGARATLAAEAKLLIEQSTYSQEMPPDRPLADPDYSTLRAWIGQDTAAIKQAIKGRARPEAPAVTQPE